MARHRFVLALLHAKVAEGLAARRLARTHLGIADERAGHSSVHTCAVCEKRCAQPNPCNHAPPSLWAQGAESTGTIPRVGVVMQTHGPLPYPPCTEP